MTQELLKKEIESIKDEMGRLHFSLQDEIGALELELEEIEQFKTKMNDDAFKQKVSHYEYCKKLERERVVRSYLEHKRGQRESVEQIAKLMERL